MLIHSYNLGKDIENEPVDIHQALSLIEAQQTIEEEPDNFIGFTLPEDEDAVLQFIRKDETHWLVDIPKVENDTYIGSYQSIIEHGKVIVLVTQFFTANTIFRQSILEDSYEEMREECKIRWGIVYNFEEA